MKGKEEKRKRREEQRKAAKQSGFQNRRLPRPVVLGSLLEGAELECDAAKAMGQLGSRGNEKQPMTQ